MRIESLQAVPVRLPLREPMHMATAVIHHRDFVITRLTLRGGIVGWGEGLIAPYFSGETLHDTIKFVETEIPSLIRGASVLDGMALSQRISGISPGFGAGKASVDMAVFDAWGKATRRPVWELIGQRHREWVRVCAYISTADSDEAYARALHASRQGYRILKVKVGMADPSAEIEAIRAIAGASGGRTAIHIDANQSWDAATAIAFILEVAPLGVRLCEQPVPRHDLSGMALVTSRVPIAIAADEGVFTLEDLRQHIHARAIDAVVLKVVKPGGLWASRELARYAHAHNIAVYMSGMPGETRLATAAGLHLSATLPDLPFDTAFAESHLADEITHGFPEPQRGSLPLPPAPGLGVDVDWGRVEHHRLSSLA